MITPVGRGAGQTKSVNARLFSGPQVEPMLVAVSGSGAGQGLRLADHLAAAVLAAVRAAQVHRQLGLVHRPLVVLLKIAFYWLNAKAYSSMAKMKAINPRIMECASGRTSLSRCSRR